MRGSAQGWAGQPYCEQAAARGLQGGGADFDSCCARLEARLSLGSPSPRAATSRGGSRRARRFSGPAAAARPVGASAAMKKRERAGKGDRAAVLGLLDNFDWAVMSGVRSAVSAALGAWRPWRRPKGPIEHDDGRLIEMTANI